MMEKAETPRSMELQCVGKLEIVRPEPAGFLCGSIPVPTDNAFRDYDPAALIPAARTVQDPRYQIIPTETDLNVLPIPDKGVPIFPPHARTSDDLPRESRTIRSNLSRKAEALAVSGLVDYEDEIDVIAPADILKQIFKMPYSKAQLSIAVRRVGQTLVLNVGPDVEEGEKLVRRRDKAAKSADESLFLNFAMHSVRMEACDCPPNYQPAQKDKCGSNVVPGQFESSDEPLDAFAERESVSCGQNDYIVKDEELNQQRSSHMNKGEFFPVKKNKSRNKARHAVKEVSKVKEKSKSSMQESEKYRRINRDGFLRVLFWQFHNFRMLLGSDLLILSNEKYLAVSLHLWDVSRQVTPVTWLEAWLDNVMASVPELAICYHQNGVVQSYELMKTEDIFLLKGVGEDGTPAFLPHVVQQNGLMVMSFLQENCKQDPGVYWLYKSAGEDVMQLFNLSMMPKARHDDVCDDAQSALPSLISNARSDFLLSLGTLLYRIAHRLSFSMSADKRARCVRFFRQCLTFLDEPDHLIVRALAHEQFARLLLLSDKEMELPSDGLPVESEVSNGAEEDLVEVFAAKSGPTDDAIVCSANPEVELTRNDEAITDLGPRDTADWAQDAEKASSVTSNLPGGTQRIPAANASSSSRHSSSISNSTEPSGPMMYNMSDSISSKMAAVHHVSQAIRSLGSKRQIQSIEPDIDSRKKVADELPASMDFALCPCGDADCLEVCNISRWLTTSELDDKSWKLVLLLGESYLALAQAYKDDSQLYQAFRVLELACLVYGSMPHLENRRFISSISCNSSKQLEIVGRNDKGRSLTSEDCLAIEQLPTNNLFWTRAWTLVGDLYVEFHLIKKKENSLLSEKNSFSNGLKMSSEVVKEVERLRKKLGQFSQNCTSCSLVNCSCQTERANSGSSASSSSGAVRAAHGRKHSKNLSAKASPCSNSENKEASTADCTGESMISWGRKHHKDNLLTDTSNPRELIDNGEPRVSIPPKSTEGVGIQESTGGIFKYVKNPEVGDGDVNLIIALKCYEEARKVLRQSTVYSGEYESVSRKKGWVCNELGRSRLERRELDVAEIAFADAIISFKEASDYTNIILINCNLGHGRRAAAEEMVGKIEAFKKHAMFQDAYTSALENAKVEYSESLRYYGAAKMEVNDMPEDSESDSGSLRDEVYTQYAHTYLRLGMLLAREDTVSEVYGNVVLEDILSPVSAGGRKEYRKHEISANEAIREALSVYESLGDLRKQEAAYAYFQLACYQRDYCLKLLDSDTRKNTMIRSENKRLKQYAALADRNWQKAMDFYGPSTHPVMYLAILMERSDLSFNISSSFRSTVQLESAIARLLEGRHLSEIKSFSDDNPELSARFWGQLQMLLKKILSVTFSIHAPKSAANPQQNLTGKPGDVAKLKELYKMALKSTDFSQLHTMHSLWLS